MKHPNQSSIRPTQTTPQLCTCRRDAKEKEKAESLATAIRRTHHGKRLQQQHLTTREQDEYERAGISPPSKTPAEETTHTTNAKHLTQHARKRAFCLLTSDRIEQPQQKDRRQAQQVAGRARRPAEATQAIKSPAEETVTKENTQARTERSRERCRTTESGGTGGPVRGSSAISDGCVTDRRPRTTAGGDGTDHQVTYRRDAHKLKQKTHSGSAERQSGAHKNRAALEQHWRHQHDRRHRHTNCRTAVTT